MVSDPRVNTLMNRLGGVYRDPHRVDRDASTLLRSSVGRHLIPKVASLVENNGMTTNTLCLKGTISIMFRGQEYQQLLDLFLGPGYPLRPPVAYVRLASANMYLKEHHPHVGSDGQVYLPYLAEWRPNSHSLIELIVAMSSIFSADPPVFTRAATNPPSYSSTTTTSTAMNNTNTNNSILGSVNTHASQSERDAIAEVEEHIAMEESRKEAEQLRKLQEEEAQREAQQMWDSKVHASTKDNVQRKIYNYLTEESKSIQRDIQEDMMDQIKLKQSQDQLVKEDFPNLALQKKELEEHHVKVDQALKDISKFVEEAESSQQQTNNNTDTNNGVSYDDIIQPASVLDEQMLELSAKVATYSDVMYFLGNALHNRTIEVTTLLREVRKYSKQQFLAKAHLLKISQHKATLQSQQQKTNGSSSNGMHH
mmetsp:Transcript_26365/g.39956  ORF Transcript_26365/g.39956 Transcript_26365/m.39956 type:complete len:423 (+) Transcript_26365:157-1425(+)